MQVSPRSSHGIWICEVCEERDPVNPGLESKKRENYAGYQTSKMKDPITLVDIGCVPLMINYIGATN